MRYKFCFIAALQLLLLCIVPAQAQEILESYQQKSMALYEQHLKEWVNNPEIINSIEAQNVLNTGLTSEQILQLDTQWREETAQDDKPLINSVLSNDLSEFLRTKIKNSNNFITEIFIMDDKGLLVGTSDITSDYWQGDEDKWLKTYALGPEKFFISDRYFDESSQKTQNQLSVTITDKSGTPIGAMTVGINTARLLLLEDAE